MIAVATPDEMRAADAEASVQTGTAALMREAGLRIAEYIRSHFSGGRIVAFAGPGNNGGDAFAALAELDTQYHRIVYDASPGESDGARTEARTRAIAAGVETHELPERDDDAIAAVRGADLAIDGLFGTGVRLPLSPRYHAATRALDARCVRVLALDVPSGIDASTGEISTPAVRATATIALAALKPGLLLEPARERCGELWIADIGISGELLQRHARTFSALDDAAFVALLPTRKRGADKRSSGAPLIVAGSEQFPGAAVLCARGAARAGAGYVTVVTSAAAAPALRAHLIEQVVVTLPEGSPESAADDLIEIARRNSSVALGPGINLDDWTGEMLRAFLARVELPCVIDAGALFHLAKHTTVLRGKRCVVTPHEGEFARLSGKGTVGPGERVGRLRSFVDETGVTTLLKGASTLVYDGATMAITTTGTDALATAGTGDVLTGIIATLLSQGLSPFDAARAGAYWHGLAGRVCASKRRVGVVAGDLPEVLAEAIPTQSARRALRRVVPF